MEPRRPPDKDRDEPKCYRDSSGFKACKQAGVKLMLRTGSDVTAESFKWPESESHTEWLCEILSLPICTVLDTLAILSRTS